jgi:hypothetical protein
MTQMKDGRISSGRNKMRIWYAPQVKRFVRFEFDGVDNKSVQTPISKSELLA